METVASRVKDLLTAMDLTDAAGRAVADYSRRYDQEDCARRRAPFHAPSVLILDEPFEAVDPVSAANIQDILRGFVARRNCVYLLARDGPCPALCDHVAVMDSGRILAAGTVDEVRAGMSLEERFVQLVGGRTSSEGIVMVGHLVSLKWQYVLASFRRSIWALIGLDFFVALYAGGMLFGLGSRIRYR